MVIQFLQGTVVENSNQQPGWYRQAEAAFQRYRCEVVAFPLGGRSGRHTPAPAVDTPGLGCETTAELAELYALALLRDVPLAELDNGSGVTPLGITVPTVVKALTQLSWFDPLGRPISGSRRLARLPGLLTANEHRRRLARTHDALTGPPRLLRSLHAGDLGRGGSPGSRIGPHVSQFLFQGGTPDASVVARRIIPPRPDLDYLGDWQAWLDHSRGHDLTAFCPARLAADWIRTPRDLVALSRYPDPGPFFGYASQLLGQWRVPLQLPLTAADGAMSTVTALLREVIRQARRIHGKGHNDASRRPTPPALCATLSLLANGQEPTLERQAEIALSALLDNLKRTGLPVLVSHHNARQNRLGMDHPARRPETYPRLDETAHPWLQQNFLLPVAHADRTSAEHADPPLGAVMAGACATLLKACFDLFRPASRMPLSLADVGVRQVLMAETRASESLIESPTTHAETLHLVGELNKLADNIALGGVLAGWHYFSDCYRALRLGERLALRVLMDWWGRHPQGGSLRLQSFDQDWLILHGRGEWTLPELRVRAAHTGEPLPASDWWTRHVTGSNC